MAASTAIGAVAGGLAGWIVYRAKQIQRREQVDSALDSTRVDRGRNYATTSSGEIENGAVPLDFCGDVLVVCFYRVGLFSPLVYQTHSSDAGRGNRSWPARGFYAGDLDAEWLVSPMIVNPGR